MRVRCEKLILAAVLGFALFDLSIRAQKAELVVETGHTDFVRSVVYSPDGRILASGSWDNTIKLWEAESGRELKTLNNGKHGDGAVLSLAFSPDGKLLASCTNSYEMITLWDVESGKVIRTFDGHTGTVNTVAFSPNGKTLASGSQDKTVKLWDVASGHELRTFSGHNEWVESVVFAPNGKTLASGSFDHTVKLWDIASGRELRTFSGHTASVNSIAFSPDGKTLASGSHDKTVKLWDVQSGREIHAFNPNDGEVNSIDFSPDGKLVVVGGSKRIMLWDIYNGTELRSFDAKSGGPVWSISLAPNGRTVAAPGSDFMIEEFDVASGQEIRTLKAHTDIIWSVAISPDGKMFATTGRMDGLVRLWNVSRGIDFRFLKEQNSSGNAFAVAFSKDGKILASGYDDKTIRFWDVQSGQLTRTFNDTSEVRTIAFSPNGRILASGHLDGTIKLWDLITGKVIKVLHGHSDSTSTVEFSRDGKVLASDSEDYTTKLWNVESGNLLKEWGPDSDYEKTKRELSASVPDFYLKEDLTPVTRDGRFQIKRSANGKLDWCDLKTGKLLASLIALGEEDWAAVDPQGRFDASPGAQSLMHFVVGIEPVDLDQIKDRYYTPNLLQRIYKGEDLDATRKVSVFTADELYPLLEYSPIKPNENVLTVRLKNRGGGIGPVQVFVNGSEFLADARPKGFDPKSKTAEFNIDLSPAKTIKKGESNDIRVIARNEAGWLRNRGSEIVYQDNRKKDDTPQEFYAIIGGISEYENAAFDLRYSAKDARDFAKAVELGAVKLFGKDKVHIRLLASGADKAGSVLSGADSKQLLPSKDNFRVAFEEFRKAKPTDVFVVYLAGHGTSINRGGDTGDTYLYLTKEAVTTDKSRLLDDKLRSATTISSDELAEWIKDVPALKRAMILDTCAAGAVEASLIKPRELSPDQLKALDRMKDRTGFYVLMGSAADAQSYEATRYGQGLLTYSLLQGMSGAKLRNGEYADVSSLFNYAEDTVTEMAKGIGGIQQPRIIAPTESRSFDIGRFSADEKSKFTLAKVKPLILQPQLSNDKLKFDNLKLSQMVAKALRDESSTIARGDAEARLVFVDAEEMNGAITPGGVYEIFNDKIKVTLILIRNNKPVKTVVVEGTVDNKEELSRKIVQSIADNARM